MKEMFDGTDSPLPTQNSYCDHRNVHSENQAVVSRPSYFDRLRLRRESFVCYT